MYDVAWISARNQRKVRRLRNSARPHDQHVGKYRLVDADAIHEATTSFEQNVRVRQSTVTMQQLVVAPFRSPRKSKLERDAADEADAICTNALETGLMLPRRAKPQSRLSHDL